MDDDIVLAALLTALEDLHNIRNEMHTCLKQARGYRVHPLISLEQRITYHTHSSLQGHYLHKSARIMEHVENVFLSCSRYRTRED